DPAAASLSCSASIALAAATPPATPSARRRESGVAMVFVISSNNRPISFLSGASQHLVRQCSDFVKTACDISRDYPSLIDKEGHRGLEDSVFLGHLPALLGNHRAPQSMLVHLAFDQIGITPADHDQRGPMLGLVVIERSHPRRHVVARLA